MGFRLFWPFTTNGKQDLTFLRIFLWLVRPYLHIDIQAFSDSCSVEPFLGVTLRMSTLMVKKQSGDTTNQQGRMTDMANQQKNWCYDDEDNKDNDNDHDIDMCIYNTIDSIASASTSLWSSPSIGLSSSHSEAKKWKKWRVGRLFGPQIWPSFHAMFKRNSSFTKSVSCWAQWSAHVKKLNFSTFWKMSTTTTSNFQNCCLPRFCAEQKIRKAWIISGKPK